MTRGVSMNDYSARDYDSFVAMDVHARSITIATLDTITGETALGRLGGCPGAAEVLSWAGERTSGRTLFAYESGPTKFDLCRGLRELGQDCGVAAVTTLARSQKQRRQKTDAVDARALLADVELADAADKMPGEISGGMRKRVAIARAMALDPEVVFLDEPSAGLDPITSSALDDLVLRLRREKGMTFVVVTHELPSIFKIADRCAMFDKARRGMIALGEPAALRDGSDDGFVRRFFNRGDIHG